MYISIIYLFICLIYLFQSSSVANNDILSNATSWGNCNNMTGAVVELGYHAAALGFRFYTGETFPVEYSNAVFIAEHGSWDRYVYLSIYLLCTYGHIC